MAGAVSAKTRAALKARAHALEPVVHIGAGGVTDAVIAEIDRALTAHELIKIRAGVAERDERAAILDAVCARTNAAPVQAVGKVMVLWRPRAAADAD